MPISVDNLVRISTDQSQKLGRFLRQLQPKSEDFLSPQLFPPQNTHPEDAARFFFFITSIDHRTSPPGQSFEGLVNGEYYQGADLLWHLSLRQFQQNLHQFHPSQMATISSKKVENWYTVSHPKRVTIRNPAERASLLRNGGKILMENYQGSVHNLLKVAKHRISPHPETSNPGLLHLLSQFKAYEDPAGKKSFLLLKFLLRRKLWTHHDIDRLQIPVDNHLTRIALRTGIVTVAPSLAETLRQRALVTAELDINLRQMISAAFSIVGKHAQRSVLDLDDFFWHFGRQCCLRDTPICVSGCTSACYVSLHLLDIPCHDMCPLASVCLAYENELQRALTEPSLETWYY